MSRAFVKEDGLDNAPLPDLPISPHPNYVTSSGLAQLQHRLSRKQADLAILKSRADRLDRLPEAAAERDIRYLEARLRSAIAVPDPVAPQDVEFGVTVTVRDRSGQTARWRIVGEDEADIPLGLIAPHAPLARALIGARVGDTVEWRKPTGVILLDVVGLA